MQHFCYNFFMTTLNTRTMVNLTPEIKNSLDSLAKRNEVSVSKTAAALIEFALNIQEDLLLDDMTHNRMQESYATITHTDVWK